jgi:hypothetical protein
MIFYAFFSKRGAGMRLLSVLLWGAVAVAVFLTESKGGFIVGGGLACLPFWIGRKWIVRLLLIVFIAGIGIGALQYLPRMEAVQSSAAVASDEGIWGRLAVWNVAMHDLQANNSGVGWKKFEPLISYVDAMGRTTFFKKGPHNSYVAVTAELGYAGLFFYLLVLAVCARIVLQFGALNQDQERSKMLLMIVLVGYLISGWLIERPYHIEYFFIAGACAAFQRQRLLGEELRQENREKAVEFEQAQGQEMVAEPAPLLLHGRSSPLLLAGFEQTLQFEKAGRAATWLQPLVVGSHAIYSVEANLKTSSEPSALDAGGDLPAAQGDIFKPMRWRRIGPAELLVSLLALQGVLEIWKWVLNRFFF